MRWTRSSAALLLGAAIIACGGRSSMEPLRHSGGSAPIIASSTGGGSGGGAASSSPGIDTGGGGGISTPSGNGEGRTPARTGGDDVIKTVRRNEPKVGRNDPCPCGSGKKYKKCHGA